MDETLRILFNKVEELNIQITEVKTILIKTVVVNQEHNTERLNRHRREINKAFDEIEELRNTIKNTKGTVITVKNIIIGMIGLIATCTSIVLGLTQLMR